MSDNQEKQWGRIFMGDRVAELGDVESRRSRAWTEKDETEYLEKVRLKAQEKAKEILLAAEKEAQSIREQASSDGYSEGLRQADAELTELRSSMGDTVNAVLGAIQDQSSALSAAWREDLAALVPLAVEKALGITLEQERRKVLKSLYEQSLQALESGRNITVKCNPEDAPAVEDIINLGKEKHPELTKWKVQGDAAVTPGGILVESESSLASNTIESRKAAIMQVLEALNVPEE